MKLVARNLTVSYDGTAPVIGPMDCDINAHTLALIGPSGGGKSTFLRTLAGLQDFTADSLCINGEEMPATETKRIARRRKLGFVFQHGGLFEHWTAAGNIIEPLVHVHGFSREAAGERAHELLSRFGLADHAGKRPTELSGGQRQRVAIARAVAAKPQLLLLDEPTSALDPEYTVEVLDVVNELRAEGLDYIIVTHEMGFARHACECAAFLTKGRIAECGESEAFFSRPQSAELQRFLRRILEWNL